MLGKGGFWFGKKRDDKCWRKTPAKIAGKWYTPKGEEVKNPSKYFEKIKENGEKWKGNTGWKGCKIKKFK